MTRSAAPIGEVYYGLHTPNLHGRTCSYTTCKLQQLYQVFGTGRAETPLPLKFRGFSCDLSKRPLD